MMYGFTRKTKGVLLLCGIALSLSFCASQEKPKPISYVSENKIPRKIAVLPPIYLAPKNQENTIGIKSGSEEEKFVNDLVRGVIQNQLAGKGYSVLPLGLVDQKLRSKGDEKAWRKMTPADLSRLLGVDGLIYAEILSATMLQAVAYDEYSLEVRLKMVNKEGEELGNWTESASKRKFAIPTSPIGAAATIAEAILDEPAKKHMRLVIYDLGWKMAQVLPDSPYEKALPEILSVESNIDKGVFAADEKIEVSLNAEDGLTCTFDIGNFKKNIPMSPVSSWSVQGNLYRSQRRHHVKPAARHPSEKTQRRGKDMAGDRRRRDHRCYRPPRSHGNQNQSEPGKGSPLAGPNRRQETLTPSLLREATVLWEALRH